MNIPVYIDIGLEEQALELKAYFKGLGADISDELSPKGTEDDLQSIIDVCNVCFKESESDISGILNTIVSMILPMARSEHLVLAFCEKLAKPPNNKIGMAFLRVLWWLFQALEDKSTMRYHVYYHLIKVSSEIEQVKVFFNDLDKIKQQMASCALNTAQTQTILRLLHQGLLSSKQSELSSKIMIELLSTYTAENASQARDEAQRCVVASIADPNTFLLDHLLTLKPVKFLEGELIHDLLTIFVSERLLSYLNFYKNHEDFVKGLNLNHADNIKKIRLLTFMQMAENTKELSFEVLQKELQLEENEVEEFVIDVLKTRLVRARMDQAARKVHISSTMHRTFGKPQWQHIKEALLSWKANLNTVENSMSTILNAKLDGLQVN